MATGKTKGFTLIEVLVVVAIVAILAAIAIPKFIGYTTTAKKTILSKGGVVSQNLCTALEEYYSDNGKYGDDGTYQIRWDSNGNKTTDSITNWLISFKPKKYVDITLTIQDSGQNFEFTLSPTPNGPYAELNSVTVSNNECFQ